MGLKNFKLNKAILNFQEIQVKSYRKTVLVFKIPKTRRNKKTNLLMKKKKFIA
jgi:hypothetical protein